MASGNYVDVLRSMLLEGKAYIGEFPGIHNTAHSRNIIAGGKFLSVGKLLSGGKLKILAKGAAQVAARNKDRPGSACASDGRLLSPVNTSEAKTQRRRFPAVAPLSGLAVNTAAPGTEETVFISNH